MKAKINDKTYNTKTGEFLHGATNNRGLNDYYFQAYEVYKTKKGEFFVIYGKYSNGDYGYKELLNFWILPITEEDSKNFYENGFGILDINRILDHGKRAY